MIVIHRRLYKFSYYTLKETFFQQRFRLVLLTCVFFCSVDINGIVRKLIELDIKKYDTHFFLLLNLILSIFMM